MRPNLGGTRSLTRRFPGFWLPLVLVGFFSGMPMGARAEDPLPLGPLIPIPTAPVSLAPAPWQYVGSEPAPAPWQPVSNELALAPEYLPKPAIFNPADLAAVPRTRGIIENVGIYGIGGGVRFGAGDSTNGLITGRIGYKVNETTALSLRPSWIFTNNNSNNIDGSLRLPLTVDLNRRGVVSPYIGGGIATNVDSNNQTNGMITGGLDLNILENITLGLNVNYIFQPDVNDTDWEAMTLLYLRF
jgi:hypothetical protein